MSSILGAIIGMCVTGAVVLAVAATVRTLRPSLPPERRVAAIRRRIQREPRGGAR